MEISVVPAETPEKFDLLVTALGYENRATFCARKFDARSGTRVALRFMSRNVLSFNDNEKYFRDNRYDLVEYDDKSFLSSASDLLTKAAPQGDRHLDVCIDVSSMSRPMLAQLLVASYRHALKQSTLISIHVVYSPAKYTPPDEESPPITHSGPVIPQLAGWSSDSSKAPAAIFGLGYEPDYALGTWEFLDFSQTWAFAPTGEDEKYDRALLRANRRFMNAIGRENCRDYRVDDPITTFIVLSSLVGGSLSIGRPLLIPFGPKIFATLAVLVALKYAPEVAVWRISGDQTSPPIDRISNGKIISFTALFDGRPPRS